MERKQIDFEKRKLHLSNERTFLSYIRTAASVLVLAVALFKFFDSKTVILIGYLCLALGFLIIALGAYRYFGERHRIRKEDLET